MLEPIGECTCKYCGYEHCSVTETKTGKIMATCPVPPEGCGNQTFARSLVCDGLMRGDTRLVGAAKKSPAKKKPAAPKRKEAPPAPPAREPKEEREEEREFPFEL